MSSSKARKLWLGWPYSVIFFICFHLFTLLDIRFVWGNKCTFRRF